jgi:hypothetical protein
MLRKVTIFGRSRPIAAETILFGLALMTLWAGYAWGLDLTLVASDLTFGSSNSEWNKIAITGAGIDGDGIDEIAVIRERPDNGRQRLYIFDAPSDVEAEAADAIASDLSFGDATTKNKNIALAGVDVDGDGIDEIAVIRERPDNGRQRLLIFSPAQELPSDGSDVPTDTSSTAPDASESEPDEQVAVGESSDEETAGSVETSDKSTDVSTSEQAATASVETGGSGSSNALFGMGGGFSPYSSGDVGVAGEESEEAEEIEEKGANKQEKSGDLSTMTEKRPALGRQPRRIEPSKGASRGSKTTGTRRSEGPQKRSVSQKARKAVRSPSRPSSFLNDEHIPNVIVKGILHCGAGDPRNIAIVELADGKKCRIQEGDIFSSIEVMAIFESKF